MDQHFCTVCGHPVGVDDLFCTVCGVRLGPPGAEPQQAPGQVSEPTPEPTPEPAAPPAAPVPPTPEAPAEVTAVRRPVPPQPARAKRRRRGAVWAWILVAAVVVAAVFYGLGSIAAHRGDDDKSTASGAAGPSAGPSATGGAASGVPSSATPTPDPQALAQAKALHTLIEQSETDKRRIAVAASHLEGCHQINQAIQTFEDAASSRDGLVEQASDLQVGLLPGGGAAVSSFAQALRASADADRAFVAWGQARHKTTVKHHHHRRTVCKGGRTLQRQAVRLSTASHGPKQNTAQEWNVIAAQFGLPKIQWTSL